MAMQSMIIYMRPEPKGRPRLYKRKGIITPPKTREFETILKAHMEREWSGAPLKDLVSVDMVFVKAGKPSQANQPWKARADIDNLVKAIFDAGNGICWKDDKQIVAMSARTIYHAHDAIIITVKEIV